MMALFSTKNRECRHSTITKHAGESSQSYERTNSTCHARKRFSLWIRRTKEWICWEGISRKVEYPLQRIRWMVLLHYDPQQTLPSWIKRLECLHGSRTTCHGLRIFRPRCTSSQRQRIGNGRRPTKTRSNG